MERKIYLDIARGIAITGVVMGHLIAWAPVPDTYPVFAKFIYMYQMPFFFIASGFHLKLAGEKPLQSYLVKRGGGIIRPFVIWCLVTSAFKLAFSSERLQPMEIARLFFAPLFIHGNFTGSWFLPCFFWAQLIVVICLISFKKKHIFAAAILTIGLLGLLLPSILPDAIYNTVHKYHHFDVAIAASGLAGAGILIKDKINFESLTLAAISVMLFCISFIFNGWIDMYYSRYNYIPLFLTGAFAGSYLLLYVSKKIEKHLWITKISLAYIGKNSLWILILHGSFGFTLNYILGRDSSTPAGSLFYFIYTVVLVGGPLLAVYIYTTAKKRIANKWEELRTETK